MNGGKGWVLKPENIRRLDFVCAVSRSYKDMTVLHLKIYIQNINHK